MAENQVKVCLWCIQRTMSTVLSRCLSAIDNMEVYLSIYSFAAYGYRLFESSTGRQLSTEFDGNEADYEKASEIMKKELNVTLPPQRISYNHIKSELENTKSKFVFMKELTNCSDQVIDFLPRGFRYVFLTRDPSRVYTSWRRGIQALENFEPADGILDINRDDPYNAQPMTWYEKQHRLWTYVKENLEPNPIIIDSFDLASQPQKILKAFCEAVGFPYSDELLRWSPSPFLPKNVVTPCDDLFTGMPVWYERVLSSTHFEPPKESGPIPRDELTDDVIRCVDYSMPFYRELCENKIQIS